MTHILKPKFRHPNLPKNGVGLTRRDYEGVVSTLCAGCGHDSVTAAIIEACFEMELPAHRVAKMSGIGCSSKTTNYFLNRSHGFNSVHGRMPSVTTGANLANRGLVYLGVSGDGDTASIGLGQFAHAVRRRLNMLYICENNGTYGLTKGQFSATNDRASKNRKGLDSPFDSIDLCNVAIELGAGFVARAFSGDKAQLVPLIIAGLKYRGFALIDVISPCVTFNNHTSSTKSYDYVRDHNHMVGRLDLVPEAREITAESAPGVTQNVTMHDGSQMALSAVSEDYDPTDPETAMPELARFKRQGRVATGLLYLDERQEDLHDLIGTAPGPLNEVPAEELCPGSDALEAINAAHR
ncbi:2-oxoglutarate oxidoreductase, beta subunit [Candidatus Rhodobacter oscarellae]|uniref:2-oxoglutarate oxidoreductase, beta subunit n=1 Tax=Candidatus Rhodobacter oscarellae TaxID=1675527 RepID=A0A0J9E7Z6_9RHOB|nr:2-oxoacid:ferredoxin oxidoreductase subunit beta [Candidatus Rhodobacter lobularis]KMW57889.1 2-oxoglutarate oxidoreductase, beta subunit [Candidatus Rhodobacter lobularis]